MRRFFYTITPSNGVLIPQTDIAALAELCSGEHLHGGVVASDVRLSAPAILFFETAHCCRLEVSDFVTTRGNLLVSMAEAYPSTSLAELEKLLGFKFN